VNKEVNMFNIGPWELGIILVVALIVVGPGKLPEVAKSIGKGINEFKKVTSGYKKEIQDAMDDIDKTVKTDSHEAPVEKKEEIIISDMKEEEAVKADSASVPSKEE